MKIGAMNHPARDPIAEIAWIGQNGFEFVDFTLEPPAADPDRIDLEAVRSALERYRLDVVAHTAYYVPLGSPLAALRQASLVEFRRCLRAAHEIGAKLMNVHYRRLPPFFSQEDAAKWHVETLDPLCREAADRGVTIILEHQPHGGSDQLETIAAVLERVPGLGFHLDSGHAKLERDYDRWDEYLDRLGGRLLHAHLSDNNGTADQHLPLGAVPRSATDWPEHIGKLKATGYDGTITLEVFASQRQYLLLSRDLLRMWWDEA